MRKLLVQIFQIASKRSFSRLFELWIKILIKTDAKLCIFVASWFSVKRIDQKDTVWNFLASSFRVLSVALHSMVAKSGNFWETLESRSDEQSY